ncbi:hypothetical protein HK100_002725 [Physocladia obscura]|uniref:Response regulatory domain-containing protein n=1 Tax=Physocladia obscura TaxID=109957 RepID=A0AAD5SY54_9FUNG|nr:hypothetical protein HK100_002725 [Physocladia obscura]
MAGDDDLIILLQLQDFAQSPPTYENSAKQKVLLWVDDHPENNVSLVNMARSVGIKVQQARSTQEALEFLDRNNWQAWDFKVITDMHRIENGNEVKDAGIKFIKELQYRKPPFPVLLYCSWMGNISLWKQEFSAVRLDATSSEAAAKKV